MGSSKSQRIQEYKVRPNGEARKMNASNIPDFGQRSNHSIVTEQTPARSSVRSCHKLPQPESDKSQRLNTDLPEEEAPRELNYQSFGRHQIDSSDSSALDPKPADITLQPSIHMPPRPLQKNKSVQQVPKLPMQALVQKYSQKSSRSKDRLTNRTSFSSFKSH